MDLQSSSAHDGGGPAGLATVRVPALASGWMAELRLMVAEMTAGGVE